MVEKGEIMQKDCDFENSVKMARWGVCDCDDGLDVNTTVKEPNRNGMVYRAKRAWYKRLWNFIKRIIFNILGFFRKRKKEELSKNTVSKVTDNQLEKMSRLVSSGVSEDQKIPVNMVRNKKTGVVVVFPGSADKLKSFYGDKADNYEIVESKIK
jgi:hypothetical protein